MAQIEDLYKVFESFAAFGSSRNLAAGGSLSDLTGPTLDGAKFAKLARDSDLLSKTITPTDIDIIFNRVKANNARRIDFDQFQQALRLIAQKRYGKSKSPSEAFGALVTHILATGAHPLASATLSSHDNITARLTDHTLYTGTHKNRFDADGKGLGIAGRDTVNKTADLSMLTNREESNIRGLPLSVANERPSTTIKPKRSQDQVVTASSERLDNNFSPKKADFKSSNTNLSKNYGFKAPEPKPLGSTSSPSRSSIGGSNNSVFDRLTDSSGYTGTHKHRFNPDGTGRGIAGRDAPSKGHSSVPTYRGGDVKDLSQILRT